MKKNVQAPLGEKDGTLQPFPGSAYSYCGNRFSKLFDFFCFLPFFPVFCLLPFFTFQPILLSLILPVFTVAFCALGLLVHYADFEHTNQCWINNKIHHLCICVNEIVTIGWQQFSAIPNSPIFLEHKMEHILESRLREVK